jgi:hypothetical protein
MARTLSNPVVEVNDVVIAIVPNSIAYKEGQGNRSVRAQSAGGNAIEIVTSEDAETKKSMCKFQLENTAGNLNAVKQWMSNQTNTIRLSEGDVVVPFRQMVVTEEPERSIGADGNLEVTFEGAPIQ